MQLEPSRFLFHNGAEQRIPLLVVGEGDPKVSIIAGLHGWETTTIAIAWEFATLLSEAAEQGLLNGQITVVPVSNPLGTQQMTRVDPLTKKDLNRSFPVDGTPPPDPWLAQVGNTITAGTLHIDLHSAGRATYWPHVLVSDRCMLDSASRFGLHFVLVRNVKEDSRGSSVHYAQAHGVESYCLEIGGGVRIDQQAIEEGCMALESFLSYHGALARGGRRSTTRSEFLYPCDPRCVARSSEGGIFYSAHVVGDYILKGEVIGYRISEKNWLRQTVRAPIGGYIIYLRTYSRINEGETLAMVLPPRNEVSGSERAQFVFV